MTSSLENAQDTDEVEDPIPEDFAGFFRAVFVELNKRSPAVLATASQILGEASVEIHCDDGSRFTLQSQGLELTENNSISEPTVQVNLTVDALLSAAELAFDSKGGFGQEGLDVRGPIQTVEKTWQAFLIILKRAAGLRYVQRLWLRFDSERNHLSIPTRINSFEEQNLKPDLTFSPTTDSGIRTIWDGVHGQPWWRVSGPEDTDLLARMEDCQNLVIDEVKNLIPDREPRQGLYELMHEYPRRGGKMLRPILCIATCRSLGGTTEEAVRIAAAIELFHNAFLIHDDIADESLERRGRPCLHQEYGLGTAINVGDGLNLVALEAVLSNLERLGLARTLSIIHEVIGMCRETVEGQAIELGWIQNNNYPKSDNDYLEMVTKKTAWYTTIAPTKLGAIAAGQQNPKHLDILTSIFRRVGVAFQIQDDLLNLTGDTDLYGKERLGDLLEGKRTLMLCHLMSRLNKSERQDICKWLELTRAERDEETAEKIVQRMEKEGSIAHARKIAETHSEEAAKLFDEQLDFIPNNEDKATLRQLVYHVATRAY